MGFCEWGFVASCFVTTMCANLASTERLPSFMLNAWRYNPHSEEFEWRGASRKLGLKEVLIKTTHAGLCYTDVHAKDKDCGLGHEGVGFVERVGDAVTNLCAGQRVGWGYVFNRLMCHSWLMQWWQEWICWLDYCRWLHSVCDFTKHFEIAARHWQSI